MVEAGAGNLVGQAFHATERIQQGSVERSGLDVHEATCGLDGAGGSDASDDVDASQGARAGDGGAAQGLHELHAGGAQGGVLHGAVGATSHVEGDSVNARGVGEVLRALGGEEVAQRGVAGGFLVDGEGATAQGLEGLDVVDRSGGSAGKEGRGGLGLASEGDGSDGGQGDLGARVVERALAAGHDVASASRRTGVDLRTGAGLTQALAGVDAASALVVAVVLSGCLRLCRLIRARSGFR